MEGSNTGRTSLGRRPVVKGLLAAALAPVGLWGAEDPTATVQAPSVPSVLPTRASILSAMRLVNDHWIGANTNPGDNKWARATYFDGNMAAYLATREPRYLTYARAWAAKANYGINRGVSTRNADDHCAGQTYYTLYDLQPDPFAIAAINESIRLMVHGSLPNKNDDWWWVDALHMAMPVFVRAARYTGDDAYYDKLFALYADAKHRRALYDYSYELWYRDNNFTPPSGLRSPSGKPVFWGRGNGWAFAAHAKTLGLMPASKNRWPEYAANLRGLARSAARTQRPDGFWQVNLGDPADYPGPETTVTAMFALGLAFGVRTGALDRASFLPVAARAWNGLVAGAVHPDGFVGFAQGVGDRPSSSQPVTYDSTSDVAVGAFLRAGSELAKIAT